MNTKTNLLKTLGKAVLSLALIIYSSTTAFALNVADSDLSNAAGTNKNWLNSFWFFVCVSFLVAAAVVGMSKKNIKIRRDYRGPVK